MSVKFHKYQATGNDFILIDDRSKSFPMHDTAFITQMCHRHWGIGSDGLILIQPCDKANFEMVFFNPDGSKSFCGNGSRSAVLFAHDLGIIQTKCNFLAIDGVHEAEILDDEISIWMNDVNEVKSYSENEFFIHTGSPHHIKYVSDVERIEIKSEAAPIRHADKYKPGGTNVNFVHETGSGIVMRTFERGVEDETLSCGTGVTAAALSYLFKHSNNNSTVQVTTRGGQLQVNATRAGNGFKKITLTGKAKKVFEGTYA